LSPGGKEQYSVEIEDERVEAANLIAIPRMLDYEIKK
jgi:hypothetical protein